MANVKETIEIERAQEGHWRQVKQPLLVLRKRILWNEANKGPSGAKIARWSRIAAQLSAGV